MLHRLAARALTLLTTVQQGYPLAECGVQNRFSFFDFHFDAYRLETHGMSNLVRHTFSLCVESLMENPSELPKPSASSASNRMNSEPIPIFGNMLFTLLGRHRTDVHERASNLVAFHIVERPHLVAIEMKMRLRYKGFVIVSNTAQIFDAVGEIPLVIETLPLSLAAESTHRRRLSSLKFP